MYHNMIMKRVFIPLSSSALLSATVVTANEKEEKKELIRPRDLPIYRKPTNKEDEITRQEEASRAKSFLYCAVTHVRKRVWDVSDQLGQVGDKVNHVIDTGKAHSSTTIQTLREEDHYVQRYGAIAVGGLIGYLLAIRRGKFRRLINTTAGAATVAAICYPEQAHEYGSEGLRQVKRYIVIYYHFINGVLRDYVGVQLPNLPGPLSISSTSDRDGSAVPSSAALMPPPASTPSHIPTSGPIPLPPLDMPSSVSDKKG